MACSSNHDDYAIDFQNYRIEPGFELSVAAAEPLIQSPVAMVFDDRARIWVVEMPGYMPDIAGDGEDAPNGRITILEDADGDGRADLFAGAPGYDGDTGAAIAHFRAASAHPFKGEDAARLAKLAERVQAARAAAEESDGDDATAP